MNLLQLNLGLGISKGSIKYNDILHVPAHKTIFHCGLDDIDEVSISREGGGHQGKHVPVIILHDLQHDNGFLLDGSPKLEERGHHILEYQTQ